MYANLGPGHVAELDPPSSDGLDLLYSHEYVAARMRRGSTGRARHQEVGGKPVCLLRQ
jgi:hypothetical protein